MKHKKMQEHLVESELTKSNFSIYGWRQVPVNPKVLGEKANLTRPEIAQVLFKHNDIKFKRKRIRKKTLRIKKKNRK